MGSCANGGGYYHYSYSVVRGCDREWLLRHDSRLVIALNLIRHHKESFQLTSMSPGALRRPRRCYTECSSFREKCGGTARVPCGTYPALSSLFCHCLIRASCRAGIASDLRQETRGEDNSPSLFYSCTFLAVDTKKLHPKEREHFIIIHTGHSSRHGVRSHMQTVQLW